MNWRVCIAGFALVFIFFVSLKLNERLWSLLLQDQINDNSCVLSCSTPVELSDLYVAITWANPFLFLKYVQ